jgi:uncharacterized membrane protein YdbT with pleckstrin-like domain
MASEEENIVWKGRSHQIVNFWPLAASILLLVLLLIGAFTWKGWLAWGILVPLAYGGWLYLGTKLKVFELTSERIRIYEGILNQQINEVELYRVKDTRLEKPFWLRLFGLSNIILQTSDRSLPEVSILAVREGVEIREKLRKQVEMLRDKKRVREVDFEGSDDGEAMEFEGDSV